MRQPEATRTVDPLGKLIKVLAEERNFTSVEIAETLWLALQIDPATPFIPDEKKPPPDSPSKNKPQVEVTPPIDPEPLPFPSPSPPPRANLAAPTPQFGVLPQETLPVWIADPSMLNDPLAIMRALKPLVQRVNVGIGNRLDESATVESIARTHLCLPILAPDQEPWFDIALVVDRGSSMHIWQRLLKDVVRLLGHYGAFRDVQVMDLIINSEADSEDHKVLLQSHPNRPGHLTSEIIDQRGRRIVILLSDCAGRYWWDGTLLPALTAWGRVMPTVVWQMLPSWMWKRSALGRGTTVALRNSIPGAANQQLQVQSQDRQNTQGLEHRISLPVVTSDSHDLARWSLMVAGDRRKITPGFLLPQSGGAVPRAKGVEEIANERAQQQLAENTDVDLDTAFNQALSGIASNRVERFIELASPAAQRLLMLLAAAPVITLPVVRLIRDSMLYDAKTPLPVAEVFLSGLIQRLPEPAEDPEKVQPERVEQEHVQMDSQDLAQYDFIPKVREVLLDLLPTVDTLEVINRVTAAVERRWNEYSEDDFQSFLINPNIEVPDELKGFRSFASLTASILEQLGGEYIHFADKLRKGSDPNSGGNSEQEDDAFNLQEIEYVVAKLIRFPQLQDLSFEAVWVSTQNFPPLQTQPCNVVTLTLAVKEPESHPFPSSPQPYRYTYATIRRQTADDWVIDEHQSESEQYFQPLASGKDVELVKIPSGRFLMGSPEDEYGRDSSEGPQREVMISSFWMSKYPITQAQWRVIAKVKRESIGLKNRTSDYKGNNLPVTNISWDEATEFCARLSKMSNMIYRLPTEAEWEYACRAGSQTPFHYGQTLSPALANYQSSWRYQDGPVGSSANNTALVGQYPPNAYGLHDMHGNVFEWCQDHWHDNYERAPIDGRAWSGSSPRRVLRGGSWVDPPRRCRSAFRSSRYPDGRNDDLGFRVVVSAPSALQ